ncbi:hypothetical protein G7045_10320 [Acidovorax sp. HDW3]|uniref:hypothetical protein n=1 Tax=Acidovorax sp. HDW3 TaxID=2714923 RepID=UPI00140CEC06|nr:hypothetical protein [Acidovorax sp. HDW3]QIL44626.1 hypothetical protein G7045_10320 [Acidovorax sp. HDW3]
MKPSQMKTGLRVFLRVPPVRDARGRTVRPERLLPATVMGRDGGGAGRVACTALWVPEYAAYAQGRVLMNDHEVARLLVRADRRGMPMLREATPCA